MDDGSKQRELVRMLRRPTLFQPGSDAKIELLRERCSVFTEFEISLHVVGDTVSSYAREMNVGMAIKQTIWE